MRRLRCPRCSHRFSFDEDTLVGDRISCPECHVNLPAPTRRIAIVEEAAPGGPR